jgi:hypothetical protein
MSEPKKRVHAVEVLICLSHRRLERPSTIWVCLAAFQPRGELCCFTATDCV